MFLWQWLIVFVLLLFHAALFVFARTTMWFYSDNELSVCYNLLCFLLPLLSCVGCISGFAEAWLFICHFLPIILVLLIILLRHYVVSLLCLISVILKPFYHYFIYISWMKLQILKVWRYRPVVMPLSIH